MQSFQDGTGRRYRIVLEGELYANYANQGLISRHARTMETELQNPIHLNRNLGPLLLEYQLPRLATAIPPNPAIDDGRLALVHMLTGRRIDVIYTMVTRKNLRAKKGLIYVTGFTIHDSI